MNTPSSKKVVENTNQNKIETGRNKYQLNVLQYPSNLDSVEYPHRVQFDIIVRGKSEFNTYNRGEVYKKNINSANLSEDELAEAAQTGVGLAAGAITYALTKNIFDKIDKSGGKSKIASGIAKGSSLATGTAAMSVFENAISANKLLKPDVQYRISDVISLYVDQPPAVSYSMNYDNKELGTLAGVLSKSIKGTLDSSSATSEVASAFGSTIAKLPGVFGGTDVQSLLSASSGTSLNPFKEMIFKSVDFRSFSFKYRFMPKSMQESQTVKRIIDLFKFHQHPELSKGKLFFIYPAEFLISYHFNGKENDNLFRFAPCVLEKIIVNYGSDNFSTFFDGNPSEIFLELTFRETEIITKNMMGQDNKENY